MKPIKHKQTTGLAHIGDLVPKVLDKYAGVLPTEWKGIPALKCWIEIKGAEPTEEESSKAQQLAELTKADVYVFSGGIEIPDDDSSDANSADVYSPGGWGDCGHKWCECIECGTIGIEYDGRSDRLPCKECHQCWDARNFQNYGNNRERIVAQLRAAADHLESCEKTGCRRTGGNGGKGYATATPRLIAAYTAARSERFGT